MSAQDTDKAAEGPAVSAPAAAPHVVAGGGGAAGRATLPADGADGLAGTGLPYSQKSLFQSSLGADLSNVRVHTGPAAAKQADAVGARAFARGSDIMFAEGEYQPGTPEGDQLLAHEVAHTVQQRDAAPADGPLPTTTPGDPVEKSADVAAAAMVAGKPASVSSAPVAIAKKGKDEPIAPPAGADAGPGAEGPKSEAKKGDEKEGTEEAGGEEIGELSVERVGADAEEGEDQAVAEPQNLEAGKQFLAAKGADKGEGGDEAGGPGGPEAAQTQAPTGGGDGGEGGEIPPEMAAHLAGVQADVQAATEQAQADADAFKAESRARQDRFDAEQSAVAMEKLQAMSAAEKRSTLIEMGADAKSVKKMKDAELDGIITGKIETEQRRTKILGMDEKELAALSPSAKQQFLVDQGVDKKDLDKIGPQKSAKAFDDVMRVAKIPGKHKVKVKIKGGLLAKSWEISVNVDAEGNPEFEAQKKGGFLSKLWGWVKLALPIIAVVLSPMTGGISLLLLSVYQTVSAIAQGDWLGAIIGAAGAVAGLGAFKAAAAAAKGGAAASAKFASSGLAKISSAAAKVQKAAQAAKATMTAAKAKSPGSLLAALSDGAAAFAGFAGDKAGAFAKKMTDWSKKLEKWGNVVSGGEKVVAGIKNKDPGAALSGAFDAAGAFVSKKDETGEETSSKAKDLQRYSRMAGFVSAGQKAAKGAPPNYGGVVEAAMGLATELKTKGGKAPKALEDANRIVASASRLSSAVQSNNPEAIVEAALGLAQTIQTTRYDDPDPNPNAKDTDGDGISDDREKVLKRYSTASSIVKFAGSAITAASAKPRPNYTAALSAGTQLIADLTENKRVDQAAVIASKLDAWTNAIKSKNEAAIIDAGKAFGESIMAMKSLIEQERDEAKKAAQAKMAPGENLEGDDGGAIPSTSFGEVVELRGTVKPNGPETEGAESEVTEGADTEGLEALPTTTPVTPRAPMTGREATPGANYSVVPGDTLSGIAQRFKTTVARLRTLNPQLVNDKIYLGQRLNVPGAEIPVTATVTTSEEFNIADLERQDLETLKRQAWSFVSNMHGIIKNWRSVGSQGAFFYRLVDDFEQEVNSFDRMLDNPRISASTIRSQMQYLHRRMIDGPQKLFDQNMGTRNAVLGGAIVAARVIKEGSGVLINVLDRTKIVSTAYNAAIGAVDAWADGASPGMIGLKAASSAFFDTVSPIESKGIISMAYNNAFKAVGNGLTDLTLALSKPGMTAREKQNEVRKAAVKVGISVANTPINWAIESNSDVMTNMQQSLYTAMLELFNLAANKIVDNQK